MTDDGKELMTCVYYLQDYFGITSLFIGKEYKETAEVLEDNDKQFTYDIEAKRKAVSKEINLLKEKVANAIDKYLADKLDE